jgi:molybdate transport system substrate-binding protein
VRLLVFALGLYFLPGLPGLPAPPPLTVSAAISLTDAMEVLGPMYAGRGGASIRFNYGGSNALARQIVRGAPVDVFISADEAQMNVVEAAGAIDDATRVNLLSNRLAVVSRRGNAGALRDGSALASATVRRIAIGDPSAVPAGVYARQYLEKRGLWTALQPKLVPVASVRAALGAAENGTVDAALVYDSDALHAEVDVGFVVTGVDAPHIVYPAAVVRASRLRQDASRFLEFLCGDEAAAVLARHKFVPLRCRSPRPARH